MICTCPCSWTSSNHRWAPPVWQLRGERTPGLSMVNFRPLYFVLFKLSLFFLSMHNLTSVISSGKNNIFRVQCRSGFSFLVEARSEVRAVCVPREVGVPQRIRTERAHSTTRHRHDEGRKIEQSLRPPLIRLFVQMPPDWRLESLPRENSGKCYHSGILRNTALKFYEILSPIGVCGRPMM